MDDDSCGKFIGSLTKYLQSLCHSYVEFNNGVELVGHIYLHVDTGKKIDYVLNESVCKNGSNVVKFTSNSYHAQPADKSQKKDPPKKAPDPCKPEEGRKRDDNDVIIVGQEAAKRRRSGSISSSQGQQSQSASSGAQGAAGGGASGAGPSSAGVFRHPRPPNVRMAAPVPPGPRTGPYPYHARKRMPSPQQPRSYLPLGASGYNPRVRPPMYQPHGVQPIGGRGTFPVPSDVASIRGEYPPASGHPGMGDKSGSSRFQHPFHPRQSMPLSMQQGHHAQLPMGSGSQARPSHLLTTMGSHLPTSMGPHLQSHMGPPHMSSSMGPQGLLQPSIRPQGHGHRFMPPYPLNSHSQRQAPSMSLPVTTQLTTTSQSTSTAVPTTSLAPPPTNTAPASTSTPVSMSAPATNTVMIKGQPVTIPASLTSLAQNKSSTQEGNLVKPQVSSGSSASSSCLHQSQASANSGANVKPVITASMSATHTGPGSQSQGMDVTKPSSSLPGASHPMSMADASGSQTMTGISPKGRPSTPALEQCAAKKGLSPRGSGTHFPFPPTSSSSSQSFLPGGVSGLGSGIQTFAGASSATTQPSSSVLNHSTSKQGQSPRGNTSAGYFRYPASESSQPHLGGASAHPLSSLSINIPPLMPSSSANHSHPSAGSNPYSPRGGERNSNPYNSLSGIDLSNPLGGSSNFHSPRAGDRTHPFRDITNSSLAHLPASGGHFHSPRSGDRSHPYMGSSNVSHSSYNGSGPLSPRVGNGSLPYMGSSSVSQSAGSGSNLHSPRVGNRNFTYMGSSNVSHESSASDSNLYSPRASYGSGPYMGSNNSSHASVSDSDLHSPRSSDRSHPYMGSSNVSHPTVTESSFRFPRGYPSYSDNGSVKLSHPSASASHLASPRVSDRNHHMSSMSGSENTERNLFSSLSGNNLSTSSGETGNASYSSSMTNNDPFSSVGGSNFPFSSLGDNDQPFQSTGGDSNNPYPSVQNGRLPFPPLSGSNLSYPTFGEGNLPYSSVSSSNLPGSSLSEMPADQSVSAQLSQVRQTENMFDMFNSTAQSDPLEARFNAQAQTDSLEARFNPPSQTDPLEARFSQLPETASVTSKSLATDLPPSSSFPLNLSHPAPFALDQGHGDRDGYSELVSELQALNQPSFNQAPTSPGSSLAREHMPNPGGMNLPEEGYPERDSQGEPLMNAQQRTSSYEGAGDEDLAPPRMSDSDGRMSDEHCQDGEDSETTASACQTSSQTDAPQTFLAPYEIGGPAAGAHGGGEEYRKRSGSVSSHSHETPSPSPNSVAGTETVVTETKPQGQQASDYDSGCDSGSTSTGERLSSPQGHGQPSTTHPQLKSLTIPLIPVDSPKPSSRASIKQERPTGDQDEAAAEKAPPQGEWAKEVDPDWAADLNNSDSTESYSEGDDPDYVPENPRSTKGSVKRARNKKTERGGRGKRRKVDSEEKAGSDKGQNTEKVTAQAEGNGPKELPPSKEGSTLSEARKGGDRYDPGMFLLLDTPSETDRMGRIKSSHTPAEVISTPEGESEGLWVHTLVPAGHGLWRLPPDDHKCQSKVDPAKILRTLYKVTVKIVAGKVLYKFDDM